MSVIANTTVVSNFASIDQLDLLRQLFGALYISTEVYDEMTYPFVQDGLDTVDQHGRRGGTSPAR